MCVPLKGFITAERFMYHFIGALRQRDTIAFKDFFQSVDVLLIDDILESGRTLAFAKKLMLKRGARRVGVAVLLEKPGKLAQPMKAEHVGFVVPDLFVVGYGMDVAHAFRELPYVGVVEDKPARKVRAGVRGSRVPVLAGRHRRAAGESRRGSRGRAGYRSRREP